jgi:hypothetical protein
MCRRVGSMRALYVWFAACLFKVILCALGLDRYYATGHYPPVHLSRFTEPLEAAVIDPPLGRKMFSTQPTAAAPTPANSPRNYTRPRPAYKRTAWVVGAHATGRFCTVCDPPEEFAPRGFCALRGPPGHSLLGGLRDAPWQLGHALLGCFGHGLDPRGASPLLTLDPPTPEPGSQGCFKGPPGVFNPGVGVAGAHVPTQEPAHGDQRPFDECHRLRGHGLPVR